MSYFRRVAIPLAFLIVSGCSTVGDVLEDSVDRCCGSGAAACTAVLYQVNVAVAPNEVHVHCAAVPTP